MFKDVSLPLAAAAQASTGERAGLMNAVINAYKLWRPGTTLSVCFTGGAPDARQFFAETSREWERFANIRFDYGAAGGRACDRAHPSHLRVSFGHSGHWSRVGTDAIDTRVVADPSLNIDLAQFGAWSLADRAAVRGVILHELGHALGLEHEHQSPQDRCIAQMRWDVVYAAMAKAPNQWDRRKVDQNLRAFVTTDRLRTTAYDPKSIMHYAFPAQWFGDPACANPGNIELSDTDKAEIAKAYPAEAARQAQFVTQLSQQVAGAATRGGLSEAEKNALQRDIAGAGDRLDSALRGAAAIVSVGRDNTGILFAGAINASTSGTASPIITNVQGDVNYNYGAPAQSPPPTRPTAPTGPRPEDVPPAPPPPPPPSPNPHD